MKRKRKNGDFNSFENAQKKRKLNDRKNNDNFDLSRIVKIFLNDIRQSSSIDVSFTYEILTNRFFESVVRREKFGREKVRTALIVCVGNMRRKGLVKNENGRNERASFRFVIPFEDDEDENEKEEDDDDTDGSLRSVILDSLKNGEEKTILMLYKEIYEVDSVDKTKFYSERSRRDLHSELVEMTNQNYLERFRKKKGKGTPYCYKIREDFDQEESDDEHENWKEQVVKNLEDGKGRTVRMIVTEVLNTPYGNANQKEANRVRKLLNSMVTENKMTKYLGVNPGCERNMCNWYKIVEPQKKTRGRSRRSNGNHKRKTRRKKSSGTCNQTDCCIKNCSNGVTNRLRFSLRCLGDDDFKESYVSMGQDKICHYHYFSDLYRWKKSKKPPKLSERRVNVPKIDSNEDNDENEGDEEWKPPENWTELVEKLLQDGKARTNRTIVIETLKPPKSLTRRLLGRSYRFLNSMMEKKKLERIWENKHPGGGCYYYKITQVERNEIHSSKKVIEMEKLQNLENSKQRNDNENYFHQVFNMKVVYSSFGQFVGNSEVKIVETYFWSADCMIRRVSIDGNDKILKILVNQKFNRLQYSLISKTNDLLLPVEQVFESNGNSFILFEIPHLDVHSGASIITSSPSLKQYFITMLNKRIKNLEERGIRLNDLSLVNIFFRSNIFNEGIEEMRFICTNIEFMKFMKFRSNDSPPILDEIQKIIS